MQTPAIAIVSRFCRRPITRAAIANNRLVTSNAQVEEQRDQHHRDRGDGEGDEVVGEQPHHPDVQLPGERLRKPL